MKASSTIDDRAWFRRCITCRKKFPVEEFQRGRHKRRICAACRRKADKLAHRAARADPERNARINELRQEKRRERRLNPAKQAAYRKRQRQGYERYRENERIRARERRAAFSDGVSRVYFVLSVEMRLVKIGYSSSHPLFRLKCMEPGSADELRLLGWMPASRDDEKRLHDRFHHLHVRREWFRATPELTAYIAAHAIEENERWRAKGTRASQSAPTPLPSSAPLP